MKDASYDIVATTVGHPVGENFTPTSLFNTENSRTHAASLRRRAPRPNAVDDGLLKPARVRVGPGFASARPAIRYRLHAAQIPTQYRRQRQRTRWRTTRALQFSAVRLPPQKNAGRTGKASSCHRRRAGTHRRARGTVCGTLRMAGASLRGSPERKTCSDWNWRVRSRLHRKTAVKLRL